MDTLPVRRIYDREYKHANTNAWWKVWEWDYYNKLRRQLRTNPFSKYIRLFKKQKEAFETKRARSLKEQFFRLEKISELIAYKAKSLKIMGDSTDKLKNQVDEMKKEVEKFKENENFNRLDKYIKSIADRYKKTGVKLIISLIELYRIVGEQETIDEIMAELQKHNDENGDSNASDETSEEID